MLPPSFSLRTKLWLYDGPAAWCFLSVSPRISRRIEAVAYSRRSAFGAIGVLACVGKTVWRTSIFPDRKSGGYLLPVKADVRRREGLVVGQLVRVTLTLATGRAAGGGGRGMI